jgi:hypothetical protein
MEGGKKPDWTNKEWYTFADSPIGGTDIVTEARMRGAVACLIVLLKENHDWGLGFSGLDISSRLVARAMRDKVNAVMVILEEYTRVDPRILSLSEKIMNALVQHKLRYRRHKEGLLPLCALLLTLQDIHDICGKNKALREEMTNAGKEVVNAAIMKIVVCFKEETRQSIHAMVETFTRITEGPMLASILSILPSNLRMGHLNSLTTPTSAIQHKTLDNALGSDLLN